ncbi:MAG: carbohydrate ABC transporter permease [Thermomicrobiales bacterium]
MATQATKDRGGDLAFSIANYVILSFFLVAVAYPLIYVVSSSFSSPTAISAGKVWFLPVDFTVNGYKAVFETSKVWIGFRNSLFYAVVGTAFSVLLTVLAAYPLSRKDFGMRNHFMIFFVFTTLFSGGLIPSYLVVRSLGLLDTVWAMIVPGALAATNIIITRTFFQSSIPDELLEAAQLDGVSDLRFVKDVVIPLSMPILMVNALFYAVGQWNSFFSALIYLRNPDLWPLQLVLRDILVNSNVKDLNPNMDQMKVLEQQQLAIVLKYALIVVSTAPILMIYPFVQKHFVRGVLIGSLKG